MPPRRMSLRELQVGNQTTLARCRAADSTAQGDSPPTQSLSVMLLTMGKSGNCVPSCSARATVGQKWDLSTTPPIPACSIRAMCSAGE